MGNRSAACNQLEKAFAAGFETYFVGDPDFVKPKFLQQNSNSIFIAAQSVARLFKPQVCFMCLEAIEELAQTAIFKGTLHMIIDTALSERPDDYPSLLALHQDRVNKCLNLLGNLALLQGLMNMPATGPDLRTVKNFQLYGLGEISKELNKEDPTTLCYICAIEIPFQPI